MLWRTSGSNTGMALKGLQIFFPIWPFLTLVMYDKDVYHFGRTKSSPVHMASAMDVHELNMLQVASASKNVYMFTSAANIFRVAQDAVKCRRKKKTVTATFPQPDNGNRKSELIMTSHEDIRLNVTLSFMRVHKRAKTWLKDCRSQRFQQAVYVRDKDAVAQFDAHYDAVKAGTAAPDDIFKSMFGKSVVDGTF